LGYDEAQRAGLAEASFYQRNQVRSKSQLSLSTEATRLQVSQVKHNMGNLITHTTEENMFFIPMVVHQYSIKQAQD
jgi:hypothetical protein